MAEVTITAKDGGSFMAYLSLAKGGEGPGLVLIQEIFGVNRVMREISDEFASKGFTVMCPDLFWRQKPGVNLTDQTESEWQQAFKYMTGFDQEKGLEAFKSTLTALKKHKACSGKVASIGYCLGGRMAVKMAVAGNADANVSYYGVGLPDLLGDAKAIKKPLMLHIAEKDRFVSPPEQEKTKELLKANAKVTIHSYPGMDHAFARKGGQHYDKEAAALANRRTVAFLRSHLEA